MVIVKIMKITSLILILIYLLLPVLCLAHPCSSLGELAHQDTAIEFTSGQSDECPVNHNNDNDNCETSCCCAEQIITSTLLKVLYPTLTDRILPYEPHLALPGFIDRIFIPPQNIS